MFFSWVHFANADLKITEVIYDPEGTDTNREWLKLHNDGNETINIVGGKINSAWRFGEGEDGAILHYINDSLEIRAGEYAILASDKDTYVSENSYSGLIADTSMSLNNTNGIVKIWDGSSPRKIVASYEYDANNLVNENNENTESNTETNKSTSSTKLESNEPEILKVTTKIISPKNVTAGIPFSFSSFTSSNQGQTYSVGKFLWNFGDGMTREMRNSEPFDYVYEYPGEYVVTLSYFDSVFSKTADAIAKVTIKVIPSEIFISSVGDNTNPFIEIENKSNSEVLLSNWVITGGIHYFKIPDGTVILSNKKIKLSPKITGFIGEDIQSVSIINPNKDIVATYPAILVKKQTQKTNSTYAIAQNKLSLTDSNLKNSSPKDSLQKDSQIINLNDLEASAGNTDTTISDSTYAFIGLFIVISVGIASFLLFKKKNTPADYIEKEIRAEDMTIVE